MKLTRDSITKLPDYAKPMGLRTGPSRSTPRRASGSRMSVLTEFVADLALTQKSPSTGAHEIVEDRFIVLAGHCSDGISGCSTDSSVRVIKAIHEHLGVNGLDRSLVYYRTDDGTVHALNRVDFQKKVAAGVLGEGTPVFDTTIQHVSDLRLGRFETTFEQSWHAKAFKR